MFCCCQLYSGNERAPLTHLHRSPLASTLPLASGSSTHPPLRGRRVNNFLNTPKNTVKTR